MVSNVRYDAFDHDIGNSMEELSHFQSIIEACFVKGGVFLPASGGSQPDIFVTERVRRQTHDKVVVRAGSRDIVLWGPLSEAECKEVADRTRVAAETMLNRVRSDLGGLRRHFSCFSFEKICRALDNPRNPGLMEQLIASAGQIARTFDLDCRFVKLEYSDAIPVMRAVYDNEIRTAGNCNKQPAARHKQFDNRILWKKMLDPAFIEKHFGDRVARFSYLLLLIRIYISVLDGECQIERDLGELRALIEGASGNQNDSLLDDLLVMKLNSDGNPESICAISASGDLIPSEYILKCVELWRATFGTRYGLDLSSRKISPRQKTSVSFEAIRRSALRAGRNVAILMKQGKLSGETRTACNVPLQRLWGNTPKHLSSHWNQKLKKFEDCTNLRRPGGLSISGRHNFPKWKERPAYATGHTPRDPSMYRLLAYIGQTSAASGAYSTGDIDGISVDAGANLVKTSSTRREFLQGAHRCKICHLVVLDTLSLLHEPSPNENLLVHLLYIVARGLPVTTHAVVSEKNGDFTRLQSYEVVEHRPMSSQGVAFLVSEEFKRDCPEAVAALRSIVSLKNSEWRLVTQEAAKKTKRVVDIKTLRELWDWAAASRTLVNSKKVKMVWSNDKPCTM